MYQNQTITVTGGYLSSDPMPTANITVNRNRVKLYGKNIYLKSGSTFEIELWNPKQIRVLAKIKINGQSVSGGGIVINPGQRVYLERFIDVDRKFVFSTYEVENSGEAREAIARNGDVTVEFYDEYFDNPIRFNQATITFTDGPSWVFPSSGTSDPMFNMTNINSSYCCDSNFADMDSSLSKSLNQRRSKTTMGLKLCALGNIETGRIEKGEKSDQQLVDTNGKFRSFSTASYSVKILPESQKPIEIGEIRSYCTGCGRKLKKSEWKFCPTCGTQLE